MMPRCPFTNHWLACSSVTCGRNNKNRTEKKTTTNNSWRDFFHKRDKLVNLILKIRTMWNPEQLTRFRDSDSGFQVGVDDRVRRRVSGVRPKASSTAADTLTHPSLICPPLTNTAEWRKRSDCLQIRWNPLRHQPRRAKFNARLCEARVLADVRACRGV